MVSLERFDHFLHDMETHGVTVLLCGVRPAFAKAMANLHFHDWLPGDRIFPEEAEKFSATLKAVRHVYELLDENLCDHCLQAEASSLLITWSSSAGVDRRPLHPVHDGFVGIAEHIHRFPDARIWGKGIGSKSSVERGGAERKNLRV